MIQSIHEYGYVHNTTRSSANYFLFSQKLLQRSRVSDITEEKVPLLKQRRREWKRTEKCSGHLSIGKPRKEKVIVKVSHKIHHERAVSLPEVSYEYIERIRQLSENGFFPFQICNAFRAERRDILWNQVHYRWSTIQGDSYFKSNDHFESYKLYLSCCDKWKMLFFQMVEHCGVYNFYGRYLSKNQKCAELLIESAHRINSSRFELLAIIVKLVVLARAVPIENNLRKFSFEAVLDSILWLFSESSTFCIIYHITMCESASRTIHLGVIAYSTYS